MAESSQEGGQQPRPHQSRKDAETQWSSTLGDAYTARVGMSGSCVRPLGLPTLQSSSPPWGGISDPPDVSLQDTACSQTMGLSSGLPLSPAPTWPEQRKDREMSLNKGVGTKEGKRKEQREKEERKGSQEKLEGGGDKKGKKESSANSRHHTNARTPGHRHSPSPTAAGVPLPQPSPQLCPGASLQPAQGQLSRQPFPPALGVFPPDSFLLIPHKPMLGLWLQSLLSLKTGSAGRAADTTLCGRPDPNFSHQHNREGAWRPQKPIAQCCIEGERHKRVGVWGGNDSGQQRTSDTGRKGPRTQRS